jgi:hypothetical protein
MTAEGKKNARDMLDTFAENNGWDKNKLIGWSEAIDFAEWYADHKAEELFLMRVLDDGN